MERAQTGEGTASVMPVPACQGREQQSGWWRALAVGLAFVPLTGAAQVLDPTGGFLRQSGDMAQSWERLQFDRYDSVENARRAWAPMGRAIATYLAGYPEWAGREGTIRRSITALLRAGMPLDATDPDRDIEVTEVWRVEGMRPMTVISLTARYQVGPEGQHFRRIARASFLVWREGGQVRDQWLPELNSGSGWFYGKAIQRGEHLLFTGGYGQGTRTSPGFLVYRRSGNGYVMVQRERIGGLGETVLVGTGGLLPNVRADVTSAQGVVFGGFGDQRLRSWSEWSFQGGRYVVVQSGREVNEFSVTDAFAVALQRGDLVRARELCAHPDVLVLARAVGLDAPHSLWFAVPSGDGWSLFRMSPRGVVNRVHARYDRSAGTLRLASLQPTG